MDILIKLILLSVFVVLPIQMYIFIKYLPILFSWFNRTLPINNKSLRTYLSYVGTGIAISLVFSAVKFALAMLIIYIVGVDVFTTDMQSLVSSMMT